MAQVLARLQSAPTGKTFQGKNLPTKGIMAQASCEKTFSFLNHLLISIFRVALKFPAVSV